MRGAATIHIGEGRRREGSKREGGRSHHRKWARAYKIGRRFGEASVSLAHFSSFVFAYPPLAPPSLFHSLSPSSPLVGVHRDAFLYFAFAFSSYVPHCFPRGLLSDLNLLPLRNSRLPRVLSQFSSISSSAAKNLLGPPPLPLPIALRTSSPPEPTQRN